MSVGPETREQELIEKAKEAMTKAYAPYSHFHVGAALLAKNGQIFTGCNIENASYGVCNCAERTALFKAVSEGVREFQAIVIVGGMNGNSTDFCPPCGVCRQALSEFCGPDMKVLLLKGQDQVKYMTLGELLPEAFYLG
ncbi:MAG: cytidine deaminase [Lachnospiraceae bacterium]|nr:cytidine deaminase [Candidatus Equihabitans merdae]